MDIDEFLLPYSTVNFFMAGPCLVCSRVWQVLSDQILFDKSIKKVSRGDIKEREIYNHEENILSTDNVKESARITVKQVHPSLRLTRVHILLLPLIP